MIWSEITPLQQWGANWLKLINTAYPSGLVIGQEKVMSLNSVSFLYVDRAAISLFLANHKGEKQGVPRVSGSHLVTLQRRQSQETRRTLVLGNSCWIEPCLKLFLVLDSAYVSP